MTALHYECFMQISGAGQKVTYMINVKVHKRTRYNNQCFPVLLASTLLDDRFFDILYMNILIIIKVKSSGFT
jgi:hypothetical protein